MSEEFKKYMKNHDLSENTIISYLAAVNQYLDQYPIVNQENLRDYKTFLMITYKPQTVNQRIHAINCYLESLEKSEWKLSAVKVQQKPFLENVISEADYLYLKNSLKRDNEWYWYFVVRFLAATGARVSELIQIKAEHVILGYFDLYTKGGKLRRIYIPAMLQKEAVEWLESIGRRSGFIFLNKFGNRISTRGIASQLKSIAIRYGIEPEVVYPHSFRHRFAKNFLNRNNDIALLADLMGHESIETTRIYLRKTSTEQKEMIDKIINW